MKELCGYLEEGGSKRAKSNVKALGRVRTWCMEARVNEAERENQGWKWEWRGSQEMKSIR